VLGLLCVMCGKVLCINEGVGKDTLYIYITFVVVVKGLKGKPSIA